jgi:hypothetical protein
MPKGIAARSAIFLTLLACTCGAASSIAQVPEAVYLWPQGAPGSEGKTAPETVRLSDGASH